MKVLIAIGVVLVLGVVLYFIYAPFKKFIQDVWARWFRNSETNLFADVLAIFGVLDIALADPQLTELLNQTGFSPRALLILGIALRVIRGLRDKSMIPLTKPPED